MQHSSTVLPARIASIAGDAYEYAFQPNPLIQDLLAAHEGYTGFLFFTATLAGEVELILRFGELKSGWGSRGCLFDSVREQSARLAQNPEHLRSSQTARPGRNELGGTIRGTSRLFGAVGLPGDINDLFALLVATRTHAISGEVRDQILGQLSTLPPQLVMVGSAGAISLAAR